MSRALLLSSALTAFAIMTPLPSVAQLSARQQPKFVAVVEAVRVDVLVTLDGKIVRDLQASDFELLDNGVPQSVELTGYGQLPLNVLMALDRSGSVAPRFQQICSAAELLLAKLSREDRAGAILFNETVASGAALTHDLDRVRRVIRSAEPSGQTALVDGVYAGLVMGETSVGRTLLVVFTDGADTASFLDRRRVVEIGRRTDVVIYTVSVGPAVEHSFLRDLVTQTAGRLIELGSPDRLSGTFVTILSEFRQRYLLTYSPRGVNTAGWHRIQVRVKRPDVSVKARPGYLAGR